MRRDNAGEGACARGTRPAPDGPDARECLLNGWDAVALTLRHEDEIAAYEARREDWLPVVTR